MTESEEMQELVSPAEEPDGNAMWRGLPARLRQATRQLWTQRPYLTIGFAIFLVVNVALVAGYLWSRGGQTVHVRVEADGDQFTAYIDGKLHAEGEFDAPSQGGIMLILADTQSLPSLPEPRGIDSVRVTDLDTNEVLFEDDFSSGYGPEWQASGAFSSKNGVLGVTGRGVLDLLDASWRNYAVDVKYKNIEGSTIILRAQDDRTDVSYNFRPFRNLDNGLTLREEGQVVSRAPGRRIELSKSETIRSLVAMTLNPYPLVLLLLALGFLAVVALQFTGVLRAPRALASVSPNLAWYVAAVITSGAFAVTLFLNYSYGSRLPHVPDSVSYIFQAKLLASGRLAAPPPPVEEVFDFFFPPFIFLSGDKWASIYPFGHPLMLAIGARLGAIWLIPPLLGAASVALVFAIGRKIYSARVGLLAALLLATSPFFLMTASNFMAHNTAVFYLLGSLLFLAIIDRRPFLFGLLAGLFFGLVFNTRPLTATALILPFSLYLLTLILPRGRRLMGVTQVSAFVVGGLLMLGAFWLYNLGTTGDAFTNGYQASTGQTSGPQDFVGFGGANSVNIGIQNEQTQMAYLLLVLNGWPRYIGLMFVLLPFIFATRHRWDWFLLGCAVMVMGVYILWRGNGVMHGPRYWYEAIPFLMLLAARGGDRAAELLANAAGWFHRALLGGEGRPLWAGILVTYGLMVALVGGSVYGWLLSNNDGWDATFVPDRASSLRGFNFVDDRLVRLVDEADLDNALVLVEACPNWWCYGNVFWMNSPTLDGNIVFARDLEGRRAELFQAYPDRKVYVATYTSPSLLPFGVTASAGVPSGELGSAPLARDIAIPTPTPELEAIARRDDQRRQDLSTIAAALQEYYVLNGTYPLAAGLQSFCRYQNLDAGCQVIEVLDPLPQDPSPPGTYWYRSDGTAFTLLAKTEGPAGASSCPEPLPDPFPDADTTYCVQGSPEEPP